MKIMPNNAGKNPRVGMRMTEYSSMSADLAPAALILHNDAPDVLRKNPENRAPRHAG